MHFDKLKTNSDSFRTEIQHCSGFCVTSRNGLEFETLVVLFGSTNKNVNLKKYKCIPLKNKFCSQNVMLQKW